MIAEKGGRLRVDQTQMAWLTELGIDRKLLSTMAETASVFPKDISAGPPRVRAQLSTPSQPISVPDRSARPAVLSQSPVPVEVVANAEAKIAALPSDLVALAQSVSACQKCGLHGIRHQTVFGDGSTQSPDWMIIGEVPGDHDDQTGLPFQGQAGALLNRMLVSAGILPSSKLFYTNLLKCRPKGARPPETDEIEACLPYLKRQIALIRPSGLLVLGWHAAQALVNQRASIDQLRGQVYRYQDAHLDIPLVVTHHPASLMLRGHLKGAAWHDLHLARRVLPKRA